MTVIVYGTTASAGHKNAKALQKHFGCDGVVSGYDPATSTLQPGFLHLSSLPAGTTWPDGVLALSAAQATMQMGAGR